MCVCEIYVDLVSLMCTFVIINVQIIHDEVVTHYGMCFNRYTIEFISLYL